MDPLFSLPILRQLHVYVARYTLHVCTDGTRLLVLQLYIERNNSESALPILDISAESNLKGSVVARSEGWKSGRERICEREGERNLVVRGKNAGKQLAG